jgi:hypothetical protein
MFSYLTPSRSSAPSASSRNWLADHRFLSRPSVALVVLSALCICLGQALNFRRSVAGAELMVDSQVLDVGSIESSSTHEAFVRFTNRSSRQFTIVGNDGSCRNIGCILSPEHVELPASSETSVPLSFHVIHDGPFVFNISFFTDCPSCSIVRVRIQGTAAGNPDQPAQAEQ